jgi:hypothetical protein
MPVAMCIRLVWDSKPVTITIKPDTHLPVPAGLDAYISLLQRCWAQDPAHRPTFHQVVQELGEMEGAL